MLTIGDKVVFGRPNGKKDTGVITKVNPKSYAIKGDDGGKWRVSIQLVQRVGGEGGAPLNRGDDRIEEIGGSKQTQLSKAIGVIKQLREELKTATGCCNANIEIIAERDAEIEKLKGGISNLNQVHQDEIDFRNAKTDKLKEELDERTAFDHTCMKDLWIALFPEDDPDGWESEQSWTACLYEIGELKEAGKRQIQISLIASMKKEDEIEELNKIIETTALERDLDEIDPFKVGHQYQLLENEIKELKETGARQLIGRVWVRERYFDEQVKRSQLEEDKKKLEKRVGLYLKHDNESRIDRSTIMDWFGWKSNDEIEDLSDDDDE